MERVTSSREIARLAGVSHMTVNRVFHQNSTVKPATRKKVLAVARQYGYQPNAVVSMGIRARGTKRSGSITGTLAWVHSDVKQDTWKRVKHLQGIYAGACKRARDLGFGMDDFWLRAKGMTQRRVSEIILNRGIRGVIVVPPPGVKRHMRLDWKEFACASFYHDGWRPILHRVSIDPLYQISISWRQLRKIGYRRIGLQVTQNLDQRGNFAQSSRFLYAQSQIPAKERVPIFSYRGPDIGDNRKEFLAWYRKHRPDVILCQDIMSRTILEEEGFAVPKDVGLSHLSIAQDVADWSGMTVDQASVGKAVVDLVVNQLVRNESGIPKNPREVVLRSHWQQGSTTLRKIPA